MEDKDIKFMQLALDLAKERKGLTHPNPTVGAVIEKNGEILGLGVHKKAGLPHAEREAIADAVRRGKDITGSTMYITLEPCCHYGKTPPCTDAIIDNRIKKVVIATLDPNPLVSGKGVEILKNKGIEVKVGVLEKEAQKLNEDFFVYIKEKRPFINLKSAETIDGKIATRTGHSKWITGGEARKYAHLLRKYASAVLVGVNTAIKDNPELTVRFIETEKQPVRVLVDKYLLTPLDYKIFNEKAKTIVFTSEKAKRNKLQELKKKDNVEIIILPLEKNKFRIEDILKELYKREIIHLLVEGGRGLFTEFIRKKLYDKLSIFIAPKILGEDGLDIVGSLGINNVYEAPSFRIEDIKKLGEDIFLELYPKEKRRLENG